jgi:uncharacterized protein YeaO (DUF488 family)
LTVKTKSIYQPAEKSDGYRVLITRFYPRGVRRNHFDEWVPTLSPNRELLFDYKEGKIDWNTFQRFFVAQMKDDVASVDAVLALNHWGRSHDITLLCYEKSGIPCHRHLVRDIVENPSLLGVRLETEDTNYHERSAMQGHVSDQETNIVVRLR